MKLFSEKEQNRLLRTLLTALMVVIYNKLHDTLIAEEWLDMLESFVVVVIGLTFVKWVWFVLLGADARAEKRQREQEAKTAASLDGGSKSGTATLSKNSPDNL